MQLKDKMPLGLIPNTAKFLNAFKTDLFIYLFVSGTQETLVGL